MYLQIKIEFVTNEEERVLVWYLTVDCAYR